jgi:hypothetical protein
VFFLYFLLVFYGTELDRIFNLYLLLVPLLLLPIAVIGLCWLVFFVINLVRRHWRRLISQVTAPVLALALFAISGAIGVTPEHIRFAVNKRSYEADIARLPQTGEPRFHTFDWGSTGGAGVPNFFYTLVFDESDEMTLAPDRRSAAWRKRVVAHMCPETQQCSLFGPEERKAVNVEKMADHFFLVTELWE